MSDNGKQGKGKLGNFSMIRPAASKPNVGGSTAKPTQSKPPQSGGNAKK